MKESLRQAAGSLLVVGLGDKELTAMERAWLKLVRPAGIILFKRNIVDRLQTRALLAEATSFCATALRRLCRRGRWNGGPAARCAGADSLGAGRGASCACNRAAPHCSANTENWWHGQ